MKLTPKQHAFAMAVAKGDQSLSDCYRSVYSAGNMSGPAIRIEACRLAASPKVALVIQQQRDRQSVAQVACTVSDRQRVMDRLRGLLDDPESLSPQAAGIALKAADLLGRTMGLYRDVSETRTEARSPEDLRQALSQRLAELGIVEQGPAQDGTGDDSGGPSGIPVEGGSATTH
jgi:hypothetical protein